MRIINKSKNSVYIEDVDISIPYQDDKPQEIDTNLIKRSRGVRAFIVSEMAEIVEYNENERIEASLEYLKRKSKQEKSAPALEPIQQPEQVNPLNTQDVPLEKTNDAIEIKIRGLFFDASGYARVNRNLALKLHAAGYKVKIDPVQTEAQLGQEELNDIQQLQKTTIGRNHILIDSVIPSFGDCNSGTYRILYSTIESYSIPKQFLDCCETYDEIWITGEFPANILRQYTKKPVYTVQTGVDPQLYTPSGPKFNFKPNIKDFVFLSVFGWNYRKGYDVLLKAYFDEFSDQDNVSLLICSRYRSQSNQTHRDRIKTDIDEIMRGFPNKDMPHMVRYSKVISEKDMPKLYRACNAFVLLSRGESICALPDTKIITENGLQPIEVVSENTIVLTHTGRWKKVIKPLRRYTTEPVYEISTTHNRDTISLTGEHPVYLLAKNKTIRNGVKNKSAFTVENCEWIPAKDVRVGDYVVMPLNFTPSKKDLISVNIEKYFDRDRVIFHHGNIYRKVTNQYGASFKHPRVKPISSTQHIDEELLKFLGFYISEGCASLTYRPAGIGDVLFAFHDSETEYHAIVQKVLKEKFHTSAQIINPEDNHRFTLRLSHSLLNEMLSNMCGRGCYNKHLPEFVWNLSKTQIMHLLYGVFCGDGCFYNPKSSPSLSLSTTSVRLADEVMLALRMVGIAGCKQKKKNRGYLVSIKGDQLNDIQFKGAYFNGRTSEVSVRTEKYLYLKVKQITQKEYSGYVHNIEVDDDQSYATNCFVVHNCLPPLEASMCGLPVIITNCSGQTDYAKENNCKLVNIDRIIETSGNKFGIHYWDNQKFPDLTSREVHENARKAMRDVYENYKDAQSKNRKLQELIMDRFTWNHTANAAHKRLQEIAKKRSK